MDRAICTRAVAIIKNEQDYNDIVTMGLALSNAGKPVPSQAVPLCGLIPKGAKNVEGAKDFLKYLIQPKVCDEYLKTGLGRRVPAMPAVAKDDPWWLDPKDPHRVAYTTQVLLSPTVPSFWVFNPAYAQVQNEHVWQTAWAEIMKDGATPQAAADKADRGDLRKIPDRVGTKGRRAMTTLSRRSLLRNPRFDRCGEVGAAVYRQGRGDDRDQNLVVRSLSLAPQSSVAAAVRLRS